MSKNKGAVLALVCFLAIVVFLVVASGWFNTANLTDATEPNSELSDSSQPNSEIPANPKSPTDEAASNMPQPKTSSAQWVDFTCNAGSKYAFTVTVKIDLSDGMDSAEAVTVANAIFKHEMTEAIYELKSTKAHDDGIWSVNLSWEYSPMRSTTGEQDASPPFGHYFEVVINPLNQTVTYSRCY